MKGHLEKSEKQIFDVIFMLLLMDFFSFLQK